MDPTRGPPQHGPERPIPPESPERGFGHSQKRVTIEIVAFVAGLVLLAAGGIWAAGAAASLLLPFISTEVDIGIGRQGWQSPEFSLNRCSDPGPLEYVKKVSAPLLGELGETPYSFEFQVVDNDQVNAFALPGGFITVNMGLLEKADQPGLTILGIPKGN